MSYSYQVYVGNLSTTITTEQLKDLFSQVGQVLNVWIKPSFEKITYGFVEFDNVISAEDACKQFNDFKLDFAHITVRISERTKNEAKLKKKTYHNVNNNDNDNDNDKDDYYQVYVGNLSTTITTEQLKDLFSQVGQVLNVWIKPSFEKITYGFVEFDNVISAENACEQFNDLKIDFEQIKVRISERTKNESKLKKKTHHYDNNDKNDCNDNDDKKSLPLDNLPRRCGILLELPKKTKKSNSYLLKKAFTKDLCRNKEIVDDFTKACVEMQQITFSDKPETIKTAPEVTNLNTLSETIKRYYKPPCKKHNWQVDIDLSKGKRLTAEENDKFFKLKLTKQRPCAKPKKENYFSLDYRTVND